MISASERINLWNGAFRNDTIWKRPDLEVDDLSDYGSSHYGAACSIEDYVAKVVVDGIDFLVLADEPLNTTYFRVLNDIFIIRIYYLSFTVDELSRNINRFIDLILHWEVSTRVRFVSNSLKLFDSSCPGHSLTEEDSLHLDISEGSFVVSTGFYKDNDVSLIVHKAKHE